MMILKYLTTFSKLLLKGHILNRFVKRDWPAEMVDAAHVAFLTMFSNPKTNLESMCEESFCCMVCKSSHPKTRKSKQSIFFFLIFRSVFGKFLQHMNSKNHPRPN